jgi:hypothetical protein
MEQAGVDHTGEPLAPGTQRQRVLDQELPRQTPLGRLGPSPPNRLVQKVDAGDPVATSGEEQARMSTRDSRAKGGSVSAALLRSATMPFAPLPIVSSARWILSCARPVIMTAAPSRANSCAIARPMPAVAPVTSAALFCSCKSIRFFLCIRNGPSGRICPIELRHTTPPPACTF